MSSLWQDVRYGARLLLRAPGFTALTVLTLGVGIGATVAVFSVVWHVILAPLPFPQPDRLMVIWETHPTLEYPRMVAAPPNVDDWARESRSFERFGVYTTVTFTLSDGERAEALNAAQVTASLMSTLAVAPRLGRSLHPGDQKNTALRPILISERIWRDWFGADPAIAGRRVHLEGRDAEIVGVMPSDFDFPPPLTFTGLIAERKCDLWVPFEPAPSRGAHYVMAIGRLRPGVTPEQADQELTAIARGIEAAVPENRGWSTRVVPLQEELAGPVRPGITAVFGAVGVVLLLACANVAALLLARGTMRRTEMAIRAALGATRRRLVRQLAIETLLIGTAGGALGLLLAAWGVRLAVVYGPPTVPRLASAAIDGRAVIFALAASLLSAFIIGLLPAFAGTGARPVESLRERTGAARGAARLQRLLVSGEIGLALVLLVASLVLLNGFIRLRSVNLGFRTSGVASLRVALTGERYKTNDARVSLFKQIFRRLETTPGIVTAGASDAIPLSGFRQGTSVSRTGEEKREDKAANTRYSFVTPGYFETIGTPLVRGRLFGPNEPSKPGTVLINQTLARRLFGSADPIGRQAHVGFEPEPRTIVGVVGDERHVGPGRPPDANIYIPAFQYGWTRRLTIAARTSGDADAALNAMRAAIREIDPSIAPFDLKTISALRSQVTATERFIMLLLTIFAAVALALSAVGVYGTMSYYVNQQMQDFGIRLALGARGGDIATLVLARVATIAGAGVILGLALLTIVRPLLSGIIVGAPDVSVGLAAGSAIALPCLALASAVLPTRRAMRVDPLAAIRQL